jgi:amino acid transporter
MSVRTWLRRTDWLWMIVGGFYLVAYLYWYVPALASLPGSVREPPASFPWHWTLDFFATGVAGAVLLFLGFRRATELTPPAQEERSGDGAAPSA